MTCSEATAAEVDEEVKNMLKECYDKAKSILSEHKDVLCALADYLYEKETLTGKEFVKIFEDITGQTLGSHFSDEINEDNIQLSTINNK